MARIGLSMTAKEKAVMRHIRKLQKAQWWVEKEIRKRETELRCGKRLCPLCFLVNTTQKLERADVLREVMATNSDN